MLAYLFRYILYLLAFLLTPSKTESKAITTLARVLIGFYLFRLRTFELFILSDTFES